MGSFLATPGWSTQTSWQLAISLNGIRHQNRQHETRSTSIDPDLWLSVFCLPFPTFSSSCSKRVEVTFWQFRSPRLQRERLLTFMLFNEGLQHTSNSRCKGHGHDGHAQTLAAKQSCSQIEHGKAAACSSAIHP